MKITFVGDIMCEPLLLKAAHTTRDSYCFDGVFKHVKGLFADSDFIIGNLETPLAGREAGYVRGLFSFNAPASFAAAAKTAGFSLLLTANNHCLDRGVDGLLRTLHTLDELGIDHTGTYLSGQERDNYYFTLGQTRYAVVSYTYGTNYADNRLVLDADQEKLVNLLRPQQELFFRKTARKLSLLDRARRKFWNSFSSEQRFAIRRKLGLTYNIPRADDNLIPETAAPYLAVMEQDIHRAKEQADMVLFCPHVGGQFNKEPGAFTEYVFEKAVQAGADAVIASHAHIVQKAEYKGKVPCFYSLGNFSMSPNSAHLLPENLPEYGLAVHLYCGEGKIEKTTFSILKIVEQKRKMLSVYPVDEYVSLLGTKDEVNKVYQETEQVYSTVTDLPFNGIQREYEL